MDKETKDTQKLERLEITQGFLANQNICFHEGLNSIVGGKGTGKSLIIEFLRFAINQLLCGVQDILYSFWAMGIVGISRRR